MSKAKIMIAEDEKIVARDIQLSVEKMGYTVCALVTSGQEAIREAAALRPDLILMDIVLKGSMDGITAAEQIKKLHNIPVLYLTACDDEVILHQAKVTQPYGYIIKPYEDKELHTAIEVALYKHQAELRMQNVEKRLSNILKNLADFEITVDEEGRITSMNHVAETITGFKQRKALGKTLDEILSSKDGELSDLDQQWLKKVIEENMNAKKTVEV